jgi:hypothetical protein
MAKLFPSKQVSLDQGNGTTIVVSKVTVITSADDFIELPTYTDAVNLNPATDTADPTFYLAGGDRCVGWHGATVGTEYTVVSKHTGIVNFAPGGATADDPK